jgi:hypothetical protein
MVQPVGMKIGISLSVIAAFRDAGERRGSVNGAPILHLCEMGAKIRAAIRPVRDRMEEILME